VSRAFDTVLFEASRNLGATIPDAVGTLPRHLWAAAADIEDHDRFWLEQAPCRHGERPFLVRSFLPREGAIWAAMGRPFQPGRTCMACILSADGVIDRKPITSSAAVLLAAEAGR
jgi:hypothetical protein